MCKKTTYQILVDPRYCLIAQYRTQFKFDLRPVKAGPTEIEVLAKFLDGALSRP